MSKMYWVENGRVKIKEGNTTSFVGDSGAVHVNHGEYDGDEALVIVYSDGKVKKTVGNITTEVCCSLSGKIVSTQFYEKGMILTNDSGERYYFYPGGGSKL